MICKKCGKVVPPGENLNRLLELVYNARYDKFNSHILCSPNHAQLIADFPSSIVGMPQYKKRHLGEGERERMEALFTEAYRELQLEAHAKP